MANKRILPLTFDGAIIEMEKSMIETWHNIWMITISRKWLKDNRKQIRNGTLIRVSFSTDDNDSSSPIFRLTNCVRRNREVVAYYCVRKEY